MVGVLGIVQARMSSTRFQGKVLQEIDGVPMIIRQLKRLRRATLLDGVVVATSNHESDDELVSVLEANGVEYFRGDLSDVLARFIGVIDQREPEVVVRLTADCPLTSGNVIDKAIDSFLSSTVDYASNTLAPTYPDGLDVEVVRPQALRWLNMNSVDPAEREHVTLGIYRRPERFRLLKVFDDQDNSALRWTVDTQEDLEFVRWVYSRLYQNNPNFEYEDILKLLTNEPSRGRTSADAPRNAALQGLFTGEMTRDSI